MKDFRNKYRIQDDIDKDDVLCEQNSEKDKTDDFSEAQRKMNSVYLEKSKNMSLCDILKEIVFNNNKDFIFNLTRKGEIKKIIHSIKTSHRFNQDEAEDCVIFVITEIFCDNVLFNKLNLIDFNNFNQDIFLDKFKAELVKKVYKMMREGYCAKEIPASDQPVYVYQVDENFEDKILNHIDLIKALNKINSNDDKNILKLRFIDKLKEDEIGKEIDMTQPSVSYRINKIINKLNKYMSN